MACEADGLGGRNSPGRSRSQCPRAPAADDDGSGVRPGEGADIADRILAASGTRRPPPQTEEERESKRAFWTGPPSPEEQREMDRLRQQERMTEQRAARSSYFSDVTTQAQGDVQRPRARETRPAS